MPTPITSSVQLQLPTQLDKYLAKMKTAEEVRAFMEGDERPKFTRAAAKVLAAIENAAKQPAMVVAVGAEGEQPLDNTTPPRNKKDAKAVKEAAAANRPHKKPVAGINPKSTKEQRQSRNYQVQAMLTEAAAQAIADNIESIMDGHDKAFGLSGNDEKFTYPVGATLRVVSEGGVDFTCKCDLTWQVKEKGSAERTFHLANPSGDLADMADAGGLDEAE